MVTNLVTDLVINLVTDLVTELVTDLVTNLVTDWVMGNSISSENYKYQCNSKGQAVESSDFNRQGELVGSGKFVNQNTLVAEPSLNYLTFQARRVGLLRPRVVVVFLYKFEFS